MGGWVVTHLEQAGFEIQSVYNMGNHYSRTLHHWLQVWEAKKTEVVKAYGERSWRRWRVFLAWSVRTARRGGSTVKFITATKSGNEKARIAAQDRLAPGVFQLPENAGCPGGGPADVLRCTAVDVRKRSNLLSLSLSLLTFSRTSDSRVS